MPDLENYVEHLRGFAEAFIDPKYSNRWVHILLERPKKSSMELAKFERQLNSKCCAILKSKDLDSLVETVTDKSGCFFDGVSDPQLISLREARARALLEVQDAIFSISPGREAVFFFHEGWGWYCKK
jgi:hypothetical protein